MDTWAPQKTFFSQANSNARKAHEWPERQRREKWTISERIAPEKISHELRVIVVQTG